MRIALIDPVSDLGIGVYTYEVAEALSHVGHQVDVYTPSVVATADWPRQHRLFPVLGSLLHNQRSLLRNGGLVTHSPPAGHAKASGAATGVVLSPRHETSLTPRRFPGLRESVRNLVLPVELAAYLRTQRYDLVWTQWDVMGGGVRFWRVARRLGLRLAHTVHNVLPHEVRSGDRTLVHAVYRAVDDLIVHSQSAKAQLIAQFPDCAAKAIVSSHGLYTMYPPPAADMRERARATLGIAPDTPLALVFGSIRPYKNTEAVLQALTDPRLGAVRLVVAGRESGYEVLVPGDPLGRTRALAKQLNLAHRVILRPGTADAVETAQLFAAADVVCLPYLESYGSGLLLMAMTYRRPVLVTAVGGMEEYVADYDASVVCRDGSPEGVADALVASLASPRQATDGAWVTRLAWSTIAPAALAKIGRAGKGALATATS